VAAFQEQLRRPRHVVAVAEVALRVPQDRERLVLRFNSIVVAQQGGIVNHVLGDVLKEAYVVVDPIELKKLNTYLLVSSTSEHVWTNGQNPANSALKVLRNRNFSVSII